MDYPIPIPKTSADAWHRYKNESLAQNPGLIFERFMPDASKMNREDAKKQGLVAVISSAEKIDQKLLADWNERYRKMVEAAKGRWFTLKTEGQLIVGLGKGGPFEVGFTFHSYGFPIIPGSSLKGLANAWSFLLIAEKLGVPPNLWSDLEKILAAQENQKQLETLLKKAELPANAPIHQGGLAAAGELPDQWRHIFGTQDRAGQVIFFDAIPTNTPILELDIMNPHYPDYYSDKGSKTPPTDWQNPNPILFLTVKPNTEFHFGLGWRRGQADEALLNTAQNWLEQGLVELGAGAKTSAGYGYFQLESTKKKLETGTTSAVQAVIAPIATLSQVETPLVWRSGVIIGSIDTSRAKRGKVEDVETKQIYEFSTSIIRGDTPGKKAKVEFALQDDKVVALRRK